MTYTHAIIYVGAPYTDCEDGHILSRHKSFANARRAFYCRFGSSPARQEHMIVKLKEDGSWDREWPEEKESNMTRIRVDSENNAESFWNTARQADDCPAEIRGLADNLGADEVIVSDARAKDIEEWCRKQPGFSEGPDFARDALIFE